MYTTEAQSYNSTHSLTSASDGGERSTSRSCRFTPRKEFLEPLNRKLGGPQRRSTRFGEENKISCSCRDSTPGPSTPQPSLYTVTINLMTSRHVPETVACMCSTSGYRTEKSCLLQEVLVNCTIHNAAVSPLSHSSCCRFCGTKQTLRTTQSICNEAKIHQFITNSN